MTSQLTNLSSLSDSVSARSNDGALYTSASSNFLLRPLLSSGVIHLHTSHTLDALLRQQTFKNIRNLKVCFRIRTSLSCCDRLTKRGGKLPLVKVLVENAPCAPCAPGVSKRERTNRALYAPKQRVSQSHLRTFYMKLITIS